MVIRRHYRRCKLDNILSDFQQKYYLSEPQIESLSSSLFFLRLLILSLHVTIVACRLRPTIAEGGGGQDGGAVGRAIRARSFADRPPHPPFEAKHLN